VEIIVEGERAVMDEFQKIVSRGPALSKVDRLEVDPIEPSGKYRAFLVEGW
jgi:acylphosphatase